MYYRVLLCNSCGCKNTCFAPTAMDDRYFDIFTFMNESLNMPFFVVLCHFCFKILADSNKRFSLFKFQKFEKTKPLIWAVSVTDIDGENNKKIKCIKCKRFRLYESTYLSTLTAFHKKTTEASSSIIVLSQSTGRILKKVWRTKSIILSMWKHHKVSLKYKHMYNRIANREKYCLLTLLMTDQSDCKASLFYLNEVHI